MERVDKRFPSEETRKKLEVAGLPREFHSTEEILERLPDSHTYPDGTTSRLEIIKMERPKNFYKVAYFDKGIILREHFTEETLAEAAGKMWLYLKEQGLLSSDNEADTKEDNG